MSTIKSKLGATMGTMLALAAAQGCAEVHESQLEIGSSEQALTSLNGLSTFNGLSTLNGLQIINGLSVLNGLTTMNGLSVVNGIPTLNGLTVINGVPTMNGLSVVNGVPTMNGLTIINGLPAINGLTTMNGLGVVNGIPTLNGLSVVNGVATMNGLSVVNGVATLNGLSVVNGVPAINGLSVINGIPVLNGMPLPNGLTTMNGMTSFNGMPSLNGSVWNVNGDEGRMVLSYLVGCALPAGETVEVADANGTAYEFEGRVGVAPEWKSGSCGQDCQEWVSSCLLAHVNTTGEHVGIWLDAAHENVGWGTSDAYPRQEGAYFGNLFLETPVAYACKGIDADVDPIPGRLCLGEESCPYVSAFPANGACDLGCDEHVDGDGYTSCRVKGRTFAHPFTVWTR